MIQTHHIVVSLVSFPATAAWLASQAHTHCSSAHGGHVDVDQ